MPSCKAVLCHCYYSDILSLYIVMLLSISFTECQGDHVLTLLASERGSPFAYQEDFTFFPVNLASLEDFLPKSEAWEKTDGRGEVLPPKKPWCHLIWSQ